MQSMQMYSCTYFYNFFITCTYMNIRLSAQLFFVLRMPFVVHTQVRQYQLFQNPLEGWFQYTMMNVVLLS